MHCTVHHARCCSGAPSTAGFEAAGEQHSNEVAKTFLNTFSKILTAGGNKGSRDGSIQVDSKEVGLSFLNFIGSVFSAEREKTDLNDKAQQTFFNGFDSLLSLARKQLGGETLSNDEIMQTLMNFFGAIFSGMTEDSEIHVQSHSYIEPAQTFFNLTKILFSDIEKSIPNDELTQTGFNSMKTLYSLFSKQFEEGGEIQSSDDQMKQALIAGVLNERIDSAEVQSLTELERTSSY